MAVHAPGPNDATEPPGGWDTPGENGLLPGIDRGWDYAPEANANKPLRELVEQKLFALNAPIGATMWESLAPALAMEQRLAWTEMVSTAAATMQASNTAALATVASRNPDVVPLRNFPHDGFGPPRHGQEWPDDFVFSMSLFELIGRNGRQITLFWDRFLRKHRQICDECLDHLSRLWIGKHHRFEVC